MESVSCMLCGSAQSRVRVRPREINKGQDGAIFTVVQCNECGLIYLNPRPTPAEIHAYYPEECYPLQESRERRAVDRFFRRLSNVLKNAIREEFYGYPCRSGTTWSGFARFWRRLLLYPEYWHLRLTGRDTAIIPFRGKGRILDVGSGPGQVLRMLREQGWDAYGVDFSPVAVEYARRKHGLNVTLGDLFQAGYKDAFFDVVLFNHALEHMYNPVATLREVHRILKPGGLLMINIPNACSFEAWLFGEYWTQWSPPQHLCHFTKQTITRLLALTGFHPVKIRDGLGTSFFLGSVDSVLKDRLQTTIRCGKLTKVLVAKPFCLLIGLFGYGSEMKVYAEKPAAV